MCWCGGVVGMGCDWRGQSGWWIRVKHGSDRSDKPVRGWHSLRTTARLHTLTAPPLPNVLHLMWVDKHIRPVLLSQLLSLLSCVLIYFFAWKTVSYLKSGISLCSMWYFICIILYWSLLFYIILALQFQSLPHVNQFYTSHYTGMSSMNLSLMITIILQIALID